MSKVEGQATEEIGYSIQCRGCRNRYWVDGMDLFSPATQWPKTQARYDGWLVGLRNYCPKCAKRKGLK